MTEKRCPSTWKWELTSEESDDLDIWAHWTNVIWESWDNATNPTSTRPTTLLDLLNEAEHEPQGAVVFAAVQPISVRLEH
jgi:hypothetical protein